MKFTRENNKRGFEEHKKYENVQGFFLESETGDNDGEKLTDDIKDNIMDNGIDIDREIACEKKKNRKKKIAGLIKRVAAVLIIVSVAALANPGQTKGENLEDAKKKLEAMQKELKNTKSLLNDLESLKSDTEAYIKKLDGRLTALYDSIYSLENSIAAKKESIVQMQASIKDAQAEVDSQYQAMKLRIQYMYENGQTQYLQMLFDTKTMADFLNRAEYMSQITAYDRDMLTKLKDTKASLDSQKLVLDGELADLENTLNEVKEEKSAVDELVAAKKNQIEGYEGQIANASSQINSQEDDIRAQKQIVAELEEIERKRKEQNLSKVTYDGGRMIWPLPGRSYISSSFGYRKNPFGGNSSEYHSGIDIPAPEGTPIVAAYSGEVAWSYLSSSAGNWVGIDHGNGIYTVYMHMSKRLVSEGDVVKTGDTIGLVGSTGRSTGNHLHFSVRVNGAYVEPLDWVSP